MLAKEFDLERTTSYKKKGAITDNHRLAFHALILLGGVTGARPGILLRLQYKYYKLDLIRGTSGRTELIVTIQ